MSRADLVAIQLEADGTTEAVYGTGTDLLYPPVTTFAMSPDREVLDIGETVGTRAPTAPDYGTKLYTGEIAGAARPDTFPLIVGMFMGEPVTTTPSGGTLSRTHTSNPVGGSDPLWASIWSRRNDPASGAIQDKFKHVRGNEFALSCEVNDYLLFNGSLIGKDMAANTDTLTKPSSFQRKWPFNQVTAQLYVGGVGPTTLPLRSFEFSMSNNLIDDEFKLGSTSLQDVPLGNLEASVNFTAIDENTTNIKLVDHYRRALQDSPTECRLVITATQTTAIEGSIFPSLVLDLKNAYYSEAPADVDGGETLNRIEVAANVFYDGTDFLTLAVTNDNEGDLYVAP